MKKFKGTSIYDNQTEERNSYFILRFNFSEVCPDINRVEESFNKTIKLNILKFLDTYSEAFLKVNQKFINEIENSYNASDTLNSLINTVKDHGKIYILIDEYDNFTNTILSTQGKNVILQ